MFPDGSISRRPLHRFNRQHLLHSPRRLQLQSQLFLQRREQRRNAPIERRRAVVRSPIHFEIVSATKLCLVYNGSANAKRKLLDEPRDGCLRCLDMRSLGSTEIDRPGFFTAASVFSLNFGPPLAITKL
jgi:hypothetical protein